MQLSDRSSALRDRLAARNAWLEREQRKIANLEAICELNRTELFDFSKAIELAKACVHDQSQSKSHIEGVITALINSYFTTLYAQHEPFGKTPEYRYALPYVEDNAGNITGIKPQVFENDEPSDVMKQGGGMQNLVSIAHRMLEVLLRPQLSPVIFFDETGENLSLWGPLVKFWQDFQKDFDCQIISITHKDVEFPHTLRLNKVGDLTKVTEEIL